MGACGQSSLRAVTIPLVVIRPTSWDDLVPVADLLSARNRAVFGISDLRLEHLRIDWELPSFTVGQDNWIATNGDAVVGYAALGSGETVVHAAADPGLGDELLERVIGRARELRVSSLRITASRADDALVGVARRKGFELETEIVRMWKTLPADDPAPVWPAGVSVRTYGSRDAERVHALLDGAYSSWDARYVPLAHDDWVKWMTEDAEFDPTAWFLAESGDEVIGCALHWSTGWLKDFAVREAERGHGLGTALLRHGFAEFAQRGVKRIGLKVDAANPTGAIRLYERHGFAPDRREGIWTLCL